MSPVIIVAGGVVVLVFGVFILMPVTFALLAPHVPFIANLGAPPAHDTIITKINSDGYMDWQTALPGYSLDLVRVNTLPECSYLVYGTYWIPEKPGPVSRAFSLDCTGTIAWDYSRTLERGTHMPGTFQSVDPVQGGFKITMDNGKFFLLDRQGNLMNDVSGYREVHSSAQGDDVPLGYYSSPLPASTVSVRIQSDVEQGRIFSIEDSRHHKEIQSVYSVYPTSDGGYLIFASVKA